MPRYKVTVYSEEWTDYWVDADDEEHAEELICEDTYDCEKSRNADFQILEVEEVEV